MTDIANETELPYPTVCRIVETLVDAGMIERIPGGRAYRPTALVQTLSLGYQVENELASRARPHIVDLCKKVGWPITVTTRVGNKMIILDSTHKLTTLTFDNYVTGYTLPLMECSVGKAYVAFCDDEERGSIASSIKKLSSHADKMASFLLDESHTILRDIRMKGYAHHAYNQYTSNPGKTSSLAVPVFIGDKLAGGLGLVFFSSAMSIDEAVHKYVDYMKMTAEKVRTSNTEN